MSKKILYVDMDNVIVDFPGALEHVRADLKSRYKGDEDEIPGIFGLMKPMPNAVEALKELAELFDLYILSTAPWKNSSAWSDKLEWVHKYLGFSEDDFVHKRLILSHHKNLNIGDFLVDDRPNNGAREFTGEWVHFGDGIDLKGGPCKDHAEHPYTDWIKTLEYLRSKA
ncbi:MAG: hypothetical protein NT032_00775 [Actinobacteria bacterium]|nr:hypothetical protein [Actinomycetota bacterium]